MFSNVIRNTAAFALWCLLAVAAIYVNIQVMLANYLGSKAALELQGYESQPLYRDSLVGRVLGSFMGEATLAQFFALGVSLVLSFSLFLLFHIGFGLFELFEVRAGSSPEDARLAKRRIVESLIEMGLLLIFLFWAVRWDMELFRFRSLAGALAGGEPEVDPLSVPSWASFGTEYSQAFVSMLIAYGAWGYLGITALGCFFLEKSFQNLSQRWARLCAPIDELIEANKRMRRVKSGDFYGYDEKGRPVFDADVPVAYDIDQNPVSGTEQSGTESIPGGPRRDATPEPSPFVDVFPPVDGNQWPEEVEERPESVETEVREVIGGNGDKISLSAALANGDRYYVDGATGQIWDRNHWNSLHGIDAEPARQT